MIRAIALGLLALAASAQPVITNLAVPKISHGAVHLTWDLSEDTAPRNTRVWYDTDTTLDYSTLIYSNQQYASTRRQLPVAGLQPGTTYYFRPESQSASGTSAWSCTSGQSGPGWTCDAASGLGKFTTEPLPANHLGPPATPVLTMTDTEPSLTGQSFSANCDTLQSQILAAADLDANLNHEIVLDAGTVCTGVYTLPIKTGPNAPGTGWIHLRTSAISSLPPEGARILPVDLPHMAILRAPMTSRGALATYEGAIVQVPNAQGYRLTGIKIEPERADPRVIPIVSVNDSTGVFTLAENHNLKTHQVVNIVAPGTYKPVYYNSGYGYTLHNGINGVFKVASPSGTQFGLQATALFSTTCPAPPCYAGGGYVVIAQGIPITDVSTSGVVTTASSHGFQQFPWANIVSISGKTLVVNDGERIGIYSGPSVEIAGGPAGTAGVWDMSSVAGTTVTMASAFPDTICSNNCGQLRLKVWMQIDGTSGMAGVNAAHTYSVIDATHIQLDAHVSGTYGGGGYAQYSTDYWHALARVRSGASRFVMSRCWLSGGGFPNRVYSGMMANGDDIAIKDSYFDEINFWLSYRKTSGTFQPEPLGNNYRDLATAIAIDLTDAKRVRVDNNYINAEGISLFAQEGGGSRNPSDFEVTRNIFWSDPRKMAGSPGAYERYYPKRHLLELKPMERAQIKGNVFDGNWSDVVPCGPTISLRSQGTGSTPDNTIEDISIESNTFRHGATGVAVIGTDYYLDHQYRFSRRIRIHNNLSYDMDRNTWRSTPAGANPGVCGFFVALSHGMEDIEISNNTAYDNRGPQPQFLSYGGARIEGLKLTNNIWVHNHDNGAGAIRYDGDGASTNGILPNPQSGTAVYGWFQNWFPNAVVGGNVVIPGVRNTASDANYDSTSGTLTYSRTDAQSYYSGFPGLTILGSAGTSARQRIAEARFTSVASKNFRLRHDSPAVSGAQVTTDGYDAGANISAIDEAAGRCSNARVRRVVGGNGIISYLAPDAAPYTVRVGATDTSDGGGDRVRNVSVALGSGATLFCGSARYSCPSTGGMCSEVR